MGKGDRLTCCAYALQCLLRQVQVKVDQMQTVLPPEMPIRSAGDRRLINCITALKEILKTKIPVASVWLTMNVFTLCVSNAKTALYHSAVSGHKENRIFPK